MHDSVMQQQHGRPKSKTRKAAASAAAAARSFGDPDSEPHTSSFSFQDIRKYCEATKRHARNPAGLARYLYRTGQEDKEIAAWIEREREKAAAKPSPVEDLFDMDVWISNLIERNDAAQLENELAGIEERGGPSADWERKVVAYFENDQAATAAK